MSAFPSPKEEIGEVDEYLRLSVRDLDDVLVVLPRYALVRMRDDGNVERKRALELKRR